MSDISGSCVVISSGLVDVDDDRLVLFLNGFGPITYNCTFDSIEVSESTCASANCTFPESVVGDGSQAPNLPVLTQEEITLISVAAATLFATAWALRYIRRFASRAA